MSKVWFITGSSRGFGRIFAESALSRGDKVIATARNVDALADLVEAYGDAVFPVSLDVTKKLEVSAAVKSGVERFGRLDVVVNNAGYGLFGTVEELDEEQFRTQMETNVFGSLWVTQAVLPVLREQQSGHIIQISSFNGIASIMMMGAYSASKWAVEALSDALAQEVAGFGIKVTIVEPGNYGTEFGGSSAVQSASISDYGEVRQGFYNALKEVKLIGPAPVGSALMKIVDSENPPLRVIFGEWALNMARAMYADRLRVWDEWSQVSLEADGPAV